MEFETDEEEKEMSNNQLSTQQAKRDIAIDTSVWTFQDVKRYFDPQNLLTEKQVGQALSLIKGRNLNPLANEVYIVAYKKKLEAQSSA